jgi:hypothetical protein
VLELVLEDDVLLLELVFRLLEDNWEEDDVVVVFVVALPSASFSEFESDKWFSVETGLYGGIVLTLPPFFCSVEQHGLVPIKLGKMPTYQLAVVVLTITTILHVVQIVPGFFTKQSQTLSTSYVKLLLATCFIALHTRTNCRTRRFSLFLTYVTRLTEAFGGNQLELNWFHCGDIAKAHFWNVESTYNVGPTRIVGALESAMFAGTQFAFHFD